MENIVQYLYQLLIWNKKMIKIVDISESLYKLYATNKERYNTFEIIINWWYPARIHDGVSSLIKLYINKDIVHIHQAPGEWYIGDCSSTNDVYGIDENRKRFLLSDIPTESYIQMGDIHIETVVKSISIYTSSFIVWCETND